MGACAHKASAPKAETPMSPAWEVEAGLYFSKLADIMDASGDDCVKLVEGLKTLEKDSTDLAKVLVDSGHELHEHVIDSGTNARIVKHGLLFDRCENASTPGFGEAVTTTLFVAAPLKGQKDSPYRSFFTPK